ASLRCQVWAHSPAMLTMSTLARMNEVRRTFLCSHEVLPSGWQQVAARIAAIGTLLLAGLILGSQVTSWILTDDWNRFPISRALSLAHFERPTVYVTASVSDRPSSLGVQTIYDWFLDLPAGGFLFAVAAVLLGFSIIGASIEKQFTITDK